MSIKIVTEPSVYLVGETLVAYRAANDIGSFLEDHGVGEWDSDAPDDSQMLVEMAGRLCYMSFKNPRPGGNKAYIGHLLDVGHGSVLEHAVFNFILTGVSRSLTHELVRHRAGFAYSQLSQRYVDESDVAFVLPPIMEHCGVGAYVAWEDHCARSLQLYSELVDHFMELIDNVDDKTARRKMAREAARSVLPNCTETKIFVTANARALRHFIEMRADPAADAEIRRLAVAILRVLQAEVPNIFGDYVIEPCPLGGEQASTPHRKV